MYFSLADLIMLIHKFDKLYSKDYLLLILAKLRILFLAWYDMGIIIDYTGAHIASWD